MHSGALREPTWMFVGGSRRSTSSDANAGERRGSDHFSGPPSPPSYAAAKACKRFEGRMVSAPNVIREGDGDRMRLRTGQMRSIASGMGGSSASSAVLPSMRFAYGPLVLPDEGCNQWQSWSIMVNQVQSDAIRCGSREVLIRDNQRQSEASEASEAIRGNQRPSEAIRRVRSTGATVSPRAVGAALRPKALDERRNHRGDGEIATS